MTGSDESVLAVLEERARLLARVQRPEEDESESVRLAICELAGERYGIDISCVEEIATLENLVTLPGLPAHWAGLVNLRGLVYPVLALARYLGLHGLSGHAGAELLVVSGADLHVALLVDRVAEIRRVALDEIRPPLATGGVHPEAVSGVTDDFVVVVDVPRLLGAPALVVEQEHAR